MDERFDAAFERWARRNEELGRIVVVDRAALHAVTANAARGPLRRFALGLWMELLLAIVPVLWLGNFAAGVREAPIVFSSAVVLDVFAILLLVNVAMQLVTLNSIDYAGPVVRVQAALERLRLLRLRGARGIFAFAVFAWLPLCVVGFAAVFGVGAVRMLDATWMVVNLLVGIAFIPLAIWLCRLAEAHAGSSRAVRVVVGTISGSSLNAAFAALERVETFRDAA
jgi:hypothetical protein